MTVASIEQRVVSMADKSQSFRDAMVWQKAHAFTLPLYRATEAFPRHELYGLTSQLRRAAASMPANFVEGFRKRTKPDKLRFYNMAQASADECLYPLILAHDPGYANTTGRQSALEEISRLLQGCINGMGLDPA